MSSIRQCKVTSISKNFAELFSTLARCYGLYSSQVAIQLGASSSFVITSSSGCVVKHIPCDDPLLKILTHTILVHNETVRDGGLLCALLCSGLIVEACYTGLPHRLCTNAFESILALVKEFLSGLASELSSKDLELDDMMALCSGCIAPKLTKHLSPSAVTELSIHAAKSVLHADVEELNKISVDYLLVPGAENELLKGILFQEYKGAESPILPNQNHLRIFLVSEAMSAKIEVTSKSNAMTWYDFVLALKALDVNALFCQKIIHHDLKLLLQRIGIMAFDRLGLDVMQRMQQLSLARPATSPETVLNLEDCGMLTGIKHVHIRHRSFIHFSRDSCNSVLSIILGSTTEHFLDDVKTSFQAAVFALQKQLVNFQVLPCGSVWQQELSQFLVDKITAGKLAGLCSKVGCSDAQYLLALNCFIKTLNKLATILGNQTHLGDGKKSGHVAKARDSVFVVLSAFDCAVFTANLILSVSTTIHGGV